MDTCAREVTPGWRFVKIGTESETTDVDGVNPWNFRWVPAHGEITVAHPCYPAQRHTMIIYEIETPSGAIRFAAGEYSNCVWGFYVPK